MNIIPGGAPPHNGGAPIRTTHRYADPGDLAPYYPTTEPDADDWAALLAVPGSVVIDGAVHLELGLGAEGGAE